MLLRTFHVANVRLPGAMVMIIVCPNCGLENTTDRISCKRCGASMVSIVPSQPSSGIRPKILWLSCLSIGFIGILLASLLVYRTTLPSALDHLHQLARLPPSSATDLPAV